MPLFSYHFPLKLNHKVQIHVNLTVDAPDSEHVGRY